MNLITKQVRNGVTLMEVLASIFVISIGLLGVLAVIPFGIFQVSKARDAEHTANMLAAAVQDVQIMELTKIEKWVVPMTSPANFTITSNDSIKIYERNDNPSPTIERLDCRAFYMVDPFDDSASPSDRLYKIGYNFTNPEIWREIMRGQDDLVFTTHRARLSRAITQRTDFSAQGNRAVSSGKYTWFMTFKPPDGKDNTVDLITGDSTPPGLTDISNLINGNISVDLLGCYNRVSDSTTEREVTISTGSGEYMKTAQGAMVTLSGTQEELDLSKTKYIFVTWERGAGTDKFQYEGYWCKIAYAPKNVNNGKKTVVLINSTLSTKTLVASDNPQALIIDGIIYHYYDSLNLTLF